MQVENDTICILEMVSQKRMQPGATKKTKSVATKNRGNATRNGGSTSRRLLGV